MKNYDFRKLNSLTKYPSIPTYHEISGGRLQPGLTEGVDFGDMEVELTEKIDGTNARQIFVIEGGAVDYFIGTREEITYARGDRILNPEADIVPTVKPLADRAAGMLEVPDGLFVIFHEIYGGRINNARQYTSGAALGARVFDIFHMPLAQAESAMEMDLSRISSWRDRGGQPYMGVDEARAWAARLSLGFVPVRAQLRGGQMPKTLGDAYAFLAETCRNTVAGLDASGRAEGLVARTKDRKQIAKLRFEDYEKALNLRGKNRGMLEKELAALKSKGTDAARIALLERLLNIKDFE